MDFQKFYCGMFFLYPYLENRANKKMHFFALLDIHYLGHKYESCLILLKLVSKYPMGTLTIPIKYQLSCCSQLGVISKYLVF